MRVDRLLNGSEFVSRKPGVFKVRLRGGPLGLSLFFFFALVGGLLLVSYPGRLVAQPPLDFFPCQFYSVDADWPNAIELGDFDEDGHPDLAVLASRSAQIVVLDGDGLGGFSQARIVGEIVGGQSIHEGGLGSADFDEDGHIDLLATDYQRRVVDLYFGLGDGRFSIPFAVHVQDQPEVLSVADVDGDGHSDFVVGMDWLVQVYFGLGNGQFFASDLHGISGEPNAMDVGDLNGDGSVDIVVSHSGSSFVEVFLRAPSGGLFPVPNLEFPELISGIELADFNGDELLDLAMVSRAGHLYAWLGTGQGGFVSGPAIEISAGTFDVIAADFNGDRVLDLATVSFDGRSLSVFVGLGDGTFSEASVSTVSPPPSVVDTADLDGDCGLDLVFGSLRGGLVGRCLNRTSFSALEGTVNLANGMPFDVLVLNGSSGAQSGRRVEYGVLDPFELRIKRPPAASPNEVVPFAVYAWPGTLDDRGRRSLPFGIGCIAMPVPMTGGEPQPMVIWNNSGRLRVLGRPNRPSSPAPWTLVNRPSGLRRAVRFMVQGLIYDPGSKAEVPASVTNGIEARPRF